MDSDISSTPKLARLGSLAITIGGKIWDLVRRLLRRIWIFFSDPGTVIYHEDIPYLRKEKSEAEKAIDKIMSKISRG
jgi:hypothetical protein